MVLRSCIGLLGIISGSYIWNVYIVKGSARKRLARFRLARLLGGSRLRGPHLVLMSFEVMRLIKDNKGRACTRFARSPTRWLAVSGSPLWF
jgi:hypothetical protein